MQMIPAATRKNSHISACKYKFDAHYIEFALHAQPAQQKINPLREQVLASVHAWLLHLPEDQRGRHIAQGQYVPPHACRKGKRQTGPQKVEPEHLPPCSQGQKEQFLRADSRRTPQG